MLKITDLPQNIPSNQDLVMFQPISGFALKSHVFDIIKNGMIPKDSSQPSDTTISSQGSTASGSLGKNVNLVFSNNKKISIIDQNNNEVAYFDASNFNVNNIFNSTTNYSQFKNQIVVNCDFRNYTSSSVTLLANKNNFIILNTNQNTIINNISTDQGSLIANGTFVFLKNDSQYIFSLSSTNFSGSEITHNIPPSDIALCIWRSSKSKWEICDYKINIGNNQTKQNLLAVGKTESGSIATSISIGINPSLNSGNTWTEYLSFSSGNDPYGIQTSNQNQLNQTSIAKLNFLNLSDELKIQAKTNSSITAGLKANDINESYTLKLPSQLPNSNNQIIVTDLNGNLSYKTIDIYSIFSNSGTIPQGNGFVALNVGSGNQKATIFNVVKNNLNFPDSNNAANIQIQPSNNTSGFGSDLVLKQATGLSGNGQIYINGNANLINYNEISEKYYIPKVKNIQVVNVTQASGTVDWSTYSSVIISSGLNQANIANMGVGIDGQNLIVTNKSENPISFSDNNSNGGIFIPSNIPNIVLSKNNSIEFTYTNNKWNANSIPPRKSYIKLGLSAYTQATGVATKIRNLTILEGGVFGLGLSFDSTNNKLTNIANKPLRFETSWNMRFGYGSPTTSTIPSAVAAERTCFVAIDDNVNSKMVACGSKSVCKNRSNNDTTQTMCVNGTDVFTLNSGQSISLYAIAPYDGVGPSSGFLTSRVTPGENLPNSSRYAESIWSVQLDY